MQLRVRVQMMGAIHVGLPVMILYPLGWLFFHIGNTYRHQKQRERGIKDDMTSYANNLL